MNDERRGHLITFYSLLDRLEKNIGGTRMLAACYGPLTSPFIDRRLSPKWWVQVGLRGMP